MNPFIILALIVAPSIIVLVIMAIGFILDRRKEGETLRKIEEKARLIELTDTARDLDLPWPEVGEVKATRQ